MFANYFKVGLRILLQDKLHSAINIFGLSVGLAGLALMLLYIQHEQSFERFLPDAENIWRVDTTENYVGRAPIRVAGIPAPARDLLQNDFRDIEATTRSTFKDVQIRRSNRQFEERLLLADVNYFDFLRIPLIAGDSSLALHDLNSVVLSQSAALKYFGDKPALGETLTLLLPQATPLIVTGIMPDLPDNSHLQYDIVAPLHRRFFPEASWATDHWGNPIFATYLRLKEGAEPETLEHELPAFLDRHFPATLADSINMAPHDFFQFRLVAFTDIHFEGAPLFTMKPSGNKTVLMASLAIAALILIIATINFINIAVAKSAARAREVAIRKIVGADRRQLIVQFLLESSLIVAVSIIIALTLSEAALPTFNTFLGLNLQLRYFTDPAVAASIGVLFLTLTIGAGIYPALILAGNSSRRVWTAPRLQQTGSGRFHQILAILQFAVSSGLIAALIIITGQISFLKNKDLGFEKDNMLIIRGTSEIVQAEKLQNFMAQLKTLPGVLSVSNSQYVPSDASEGNISLQGPGKEGATVVGFQNVGVGFFEAYNIKPSAGRLYNSNRDLTVASSGTVSASHSVVINALAAKRFGFMSPAGAIGQSITNKNTGGAWTIIGVVPNIHFRSLHHELRDEVYFLDPSSGIISVRHDGTALSSIISGANKVWESFSAGQPMQLEILADAVAKLYASEEKQQNILTVFAFFAGLVSMLGLYGLTTHSINRKAKEVAVRKVFGANTAAIQKLMVWQFTGPIMIGNILGWPITAYIMQDWLSGFTFRNDLTASPFVFAGLVTISLGVLVVGGHVFKVARANPIGPLRQL